MIAFFLVFIGGGLGSICRFWLLRQITPMGLSFPWATFTANILSCLILGVLIGLRLRGNISQSSQFLLVTGFCGGFSTFSTFSFETFQLLQEGRWLIAFSNAALSLILGLLAVFAGIRLMS